MCHLKIEYKMYCEHLDLYHKVIANECAETLEQSLKLVIPIFISKYGYNVGLNSIRQSGLVL